MRVTLMMVASVDGKTTKWNDPNIYHWTSPEDQRLFFSAIEQASAIIMGRHTYLAAQPVIKLQPGKLRTVMTSDPSRFQAETVPDQLEFSSQQPTDLLQNLSERGYDHVLLVGGATTNAAFLNAKLVDEIWITLEPRIFGQGSGLATSGAPLNTGLKLLEQSQLNHRGTLCLKYQVL